MPTECSAALFEFARVEGRSVVAGFDGGKITSDAGALLLRASDQAIGLIDRFARCFSDRRSPELVEHTVATLVGQRIFGIALGYEDVLDHDDLRHDPIMAVLAGKLAARRKNCASVAGKSTLNRLELGSRRRRPTTRSGTTRRRSKLCWSIYLSRPRRVRRGRSSSISMPPTTRCTGTRACPGAGRRGASSTAITTAITTATATCRCTSSATGTCWRPNCAVPISTPALGRSRRSRALSLTSAPAGHGCRSYCAPTQGLPANS